MDIKKSALSGLFWTFCQQFGGQFISLVTSIILARILEPADFGLIGMLTLFLSIGNLLIDGGLSNSVIRIQHPEESDYSTVFFINIIGSLFIYFVIYFLAPFIATFYHKPQLTLITRIYTLTFIINAFATIQTTKLTKELRFKLQMLMQLPSLIIGGVIGVFLALHGFGVWSIVWLNIISSAIFVGSHWIFSGWYPRLLFSKEKFKTHFNFGYKLTFSGILDTIFENFYNIVIGRFYSAEKLGYYTRAQTIAILPVQSLSTALNKVAYPLFSKIQDDPIRLKNAFKRILQIIIFWVAIIMICFQAIALPFFKLLLTDKWVPAVPMFKILCISAILYPVHLYNLIILLIKGRTDLFLRLEIAKKILMVVGGIFALRHGIYGLLYFQIIFSCIAFFINTFYSGRMINYSLKEQIIDLAPIFIISVIVFAFAEFVNYVMPEYILSNNWLNIVVISCGCLGLYILLGFLFKLQPLVETVKTIKERLK